MTMFKINAARPTDSGDMQARAELIITANIGTTKNIDMKINTVNFDFFKSIQADFNIEIIDMFLFIRFPINLK